MKKILFVASMLCAGAFSAYSQTTATDFTAADCSGVSHHLFDELNAGKIIVVSFVMPCGSCIGPSMSAKTIVDGYASSHPGRVLFYIADDDAVTNCTSLNGWVSANSMTGVTTFSNPAFVQANYGSPGMPKVVVLGGTSHHIFFNENNTISTTNLQNAINSALSTTAIKQVNVESVQPEVLPNPTTNSISVKYTLGTATTVSMEILNVVGAKLKTVNTAGQAAGSYETNIDFSDELANGLYLLKINAGGTSHIARFVVAN